MIELDKELEDDVLYKSRPSGLAIGGRAYTVAGGYGADRSSYLDSSSGVGGGSGYKSKYMEDLDLDSDMRSITSGDTGRSSSRYGSGYMSATTTTRGRRGRSMSMYEVDLEMGSEATSLVPTNGMSSTRSRFSSKYGVSGLGKCYFVYFLNSLRINYIILINIGSYFIASLYFRYSPYPRSITTGYSEYLLLLA